MAAVVAGGCLGSASAGAWEPTRNVEFVVPAGTGGGADQMARMMQGIIQKNNLMKQSIVVINKSGGAGAEAFLDVKNSKRQSSQDCYHTIESLHYAAGHRRPFQLAGSDAGGDDGARRVRPLGERQVAAPDRGRLRRGAQGRRRPGQMKMGGTGSKQEDQIITAAIEQATGAKLTYIPYKGGGDVAAQLVGGHVDSSVNNPIEAVAQWRAGELRPLCVFDTVRLPYKEPVADGRRGRTSRPAARPASTSTT
jgi:tripartite-type tricarboxylate transporter receptor subunit TctC